MSTDVGAKKRAGIVLILTGVVLLVVAVVPGTGAFTAAGIGPGRITVLVLALLAVLFGAALTRRKGHTATPPE